MGAISVARQQAEPLAAEQGLEIVGRSGYWGLRRKRDGARMLFVRMSGRKTRTVPHLPMLVRYLRAMTPAYIVVEVNH